jgi:hypothetical protein
MSQQVDDLAGAAIKAGAGWTVERKAMRLGLCHRVLAVEEHLGATVMD